MSTATLTATAQIPRHELLRDRLVKLGMAQHGDQFQPDDGVPGWNLRDVGGGFGLGIAGQEFFISDSAPLDDRLTETIGRLMADGRARQAVADSEAEAVAVEVLPELQRAIKAIDTLLAHPLAVGDPPTEEEQLRQAADTLAATNRRLAADSLTPANRDLARRAERELAAKAERDARILARLKQKGLHTVAHAFRVEGERAAVEHLKWMRERTALEQRRHDDEIGLALQEAALLAEFDAAEDARVDEHYAEFLTDDPYED